MKSEILFELPESLKIFSEFFDPQAAPWEWVRNIKAALSSVDFSKYETKRDIPRHVTVDGDVFIHPSVKLPAFAHISGKAWIGANTEIRPGAFIRGSVIIGENCVVGNSCEYKNSILMDYVQTPHYNYVGDSVLGNHSHLGAGVICANLRLDHENVMVTTPEGRKNSGLRKLGAILGDYAEAGCNAVLQPGAILMKKACVLSCVPFAGLLEESTVASTKQVIRRFPRRGF